MRPLIVTEFVTLDGVVEAPGGEATHSDSGWSAAYGVGPLEDAGGSPVLVAGSATLVRTLLTAGHVDELRLMVSPVLIGGGKRIWPEERQKVELDLVELVRYDSGATLQVFRAAR